MVHIQGIETLHLSIILFENLRNSFAFLLCAHSLLEVLTISPFTIT
jgi:hypothetical protein